jgi:hypothetical protein
MSSDALRRNATPRSALVGIQECRPRVTIQNRSPDNSHGPQLLAFGDGNAEY